MTLLFQALAGELVNVLREARQVVPDALLKFGTHVKKKVYSSILFVVFFFFSFDLLLIHLLGTYVWKCCASKLSHLFSALN